MFRYYLVRTMDDFHLRPFVEEQLGKLHNNEFSSCKEKKIFLMMTPTYGNLGDQAIAVGTLQYLHDFFPEYKVIEIDLKNTYKKIPSIKRVINDEDIIVLQGGGNLGNLYQYIENYRRGIIKRLSDYRIISMPITSTFTDNKQGKKQLEISQKVYSKCKDFTILAREKKSYDFLKENFSNIQIKCTPDMAFYISNTNLVPLNANRHGVVICLRRDWEMINDRVDDLIGEIFKEYSDCRIYDTYVTRDIFPQMRELEVKAAMQEFASSEFVITDRLHAMIMCALTATPCIVTKALDWKISGTYEWIKSCPYIKFVDKLDIKTIKNQLLCIEDKREYNLRDELLPYFNKLKSSII